MARKSLLSPLAAMFSGPLPALIALFVGSFLIASAASAQATGDLADSFPTGPNVSYKRVAPNKLLVTVTRPSADDDADSWAAFVRAIFSQNFSPSAWPGGWPVLVGQSQLAVLMREHENSVFRDWVADRRLRPGDILGLGGPSSSATADMILNIFKDAPRNWAQGATLVFMGSSSDRERVFDALRSSGATIRFFDLDKVHTVTMEHSIPHLDGPPLPPPPPPSSILH